LKQLDERTPVTPIPSINRYPVHRPYLNGVKSSPVIAAIILRFRAAEVTRKWQILAWSGPLDW
jgi:hypothetical protein